MGYQEFFRQEILKEDFHCDSETDQLLAAAIYNASEKYEYAGSTCVTTSPTLRTSACRTQPLMAVGIYIFHIT